jgi:hypothetical protein
MDQNAVILELLRQALAPKPPDHLGDLIKIGLPLLGAVIGGLIGFFSARRAAEIDRLAQVEVASQNRRTELKKELGARRALRFEDVLSKLDTFSQGLSNYVTLIENGIEMQASGALPAQKMAEIEKSQDDFYGGFLALLTAESRLLALGHADVQKELRSFGESSQDIYTKVRLNGSLTVEQIQQEMKALGDKRYNLIIKIGQAETLWWEA